MKKAFIMVIGGCGCVCLIMIILGISFLSSDGDLPKETSAKNIIVSMVEENYDSLKKVTMRLQEYDIGDQFYLADKEDIEVNDSLVKDFLYVDHNTDDDVGYIIPEVVDDNVIKRILKISEICEIYRGEKLIDFIGNPELCKDQNGGFCGFYYSLDGEPKSVGCFTGEALKTDDSGWCFEGNEEFSNYYTEKIKGNFFYYEGVFYP